MEDLKAVFKPQMTAKQPVIIAGPCSAESKEQTLASAEALHSMGVCCFRAGLWKPRTKPGCFEGVGTIGLPWLAEVRRLTGMKVFTEIASPQHLKAAIHHGVNSFWIGARTSANPFAVQAIADELKTMSYDVRNRISILIKNPVNPDIELWIGAFQRIYDSGVRRLGAIHRGFSAYSEHVYRNRPEWSIPLELRHRFPQLPLICDPSHIAGRRDLIEPLSQYALDLNFDGLMIETHCSPETALSDGGQQITPNELKTLLDKLVVRDGTLPEDSLRIYREEIDNIDNELISLLARRMSVSRLIGELKQKYKIPVWQSDRYKELLSRHEAESFRIGLSEEFVRKILTAVHEESVKIQLHLNNDKAGDVI